MSSKAVSIIAGLGLALAGSAATAQTISGPIKLIVPFAAGGASDILARLAANYAADLGVQMVVENRTGAGGNIGFEAGAKAAPDGRTLVLCTLGCATNGFIYKNLSWDAQRDLRPVVMVGIVPNVLVVTASMPVNTAQEFFALARQKPGQISIASSGIGTSSHFGGVLIQHLAKIELLEVPFRGSGAVLNDLVSGQIMSMTSGVPESTPLVKEGKLKALGVTTRKRASSMPDVPTLEEAGLPGYEVIPWSAIMVPKATPDAIVAKLNDAFNKGLKNPELLNRFKELGIEPGGGTPEEMAAFLKEEIGRWGPVIQARGIKIE